MTPGAGHFPGRNRTAVCQGKECGRDKIPIPQWIRAPLVAAGSRAGNPAKLSLAAREFACTTNPKPEPVMPLRIEPCPANGRSLIPGRNLKDPHPESRQRNGDFAIGAPGHHRPGINAPQSRVRRSQRRLARVNVGRFVCFGQVDRDENPMRSVKTDEGENGIVVVPDDRLLASDQRGMRLPECNQVFVVRQD